MADLHRKIGSHRFQAGLTMMALACLGLTLTSCGPTKPAIKNLPQAELPLNARLFRAPYDHVWNTVINTLRLKHLFPISVEDPKKGVFSTDYIYAENQKGRRYRLSGSVVKSEQGQVVTLYRYQQVFVQEKWKAIKTNYRLEKLLLNDIERQLN